jgi:hypothetical protein
MFQATQVISMPRQLKSVRYNMLFARRAQKGNTAGNVRVKQHLSVFGSLQTGEFLDGHYINLPKL